MIGISEFGKEVGIKLPLQVGLLLVIMADSEEIDLPSNLCNRDTF